MKTAGSSRGTLFTKLRLTGRKKSNRGWQDCLGRVLRFESLEDRRLLATVDTWFDIIDGTDGLTSLREAIIDTPAGGTVDFSTNPAHGLNGATISLLGEIAFSKNLTIDASMLPDGITISTASADPTPEEKNGDGIRIFNIMGSSTTLVTMKGLTLTGGDVNGNCVYHYSAGVAMDA